MLNKKDLDMLQEVLNEEILSYLDLENKRYREIVEQLQNKIKYDNYLKKRKQKND